MFYVIIAEMMNNVSNVPNHILQNLDLFGAQLVKDNLIFIDDRLDSFLENHPTDAIHILPWFANVQDGVLLEILEGLRDWHRGTKSKHEVIAAHSLALMS